MVNLKPALTYEEQVEHLIKAHNLSIDDTEKAVRTLQRVNYYRPECIWHWAYTERESRKIQRRDFFKTHPQTL